MVLDALRPLLPAFIERELRAPEQYPRESLNDLFRVGAIASPFPRSAGGSGATLEESVRLLEAVAAASPSTALLASMPLGLAAAFTAGAELAPDEHRAAAARQMAEAAAAYITGTYYAACNSEKGAGGSLLDMKTVAAREPGGGFVLSGEKILASGGRNADYFFSAAKIDPAGLPGAGAVELFIVPTGAPGVTILDDWDGFGMRPTESHTVRYDRAPAVGLIGFPGFMEAAQPLQYWFCLFAAIPLGCAGTMLRELGQPAPESPALRLRLVDLQARYEAARAYLLETARGWTPGGSPSWRSRVLRTKTFVSQESTRICADLFALSGGRHYRRSSRVARLLADSFAGTALRPPLPLAIEALAQEFALEPD